MKDINKKTFKVDDYIMYAYVDCDQKPFLKYGCIVEMQGDLCKMVSIRVKEDGTLAPPYSPRAFAKLSPGRAITIDPSTINKEILKQLQNATTKYKEKQYGKKKK